ncbi:transcriptional regulator [Bacillus phage Moonbeam]|uniref:DNA-binding protein n=1 Tax=Bacillus phage Moonbeam TaxID=1540091 RepID=A0A0A0RV22_9CAUD|nr:transcriptional regulator [Bacillus phage Moonbeam]AIW03448.1 DNA-binding protein [Bacillus phage Moonbeam]
MTQKSEHTPKKLKKYRLDRGFTIYTLADRVGVHYSSVSGWENGNKFPRIDKLMALEEIFDENYRELFSNLTPEEAKDVEERIKQSRLKPNKQES